MHEAADTTDWILPTPPIRTAITQVAQPAGDAIPPPERPSRPARSSARRLHPLLLILLLLAAGLTVAVIVTRGGTTPDRVAKRKPVTILRTITEPGRTIEQTVTAPAPPPATTPTTTPAPPTTTPALAHPSGADLNTEGYAKMQAGDYQSTLPLLEQAVQQLDGTGSLDEAYADYNLAYMRYELGQCTGVLPLLDHSQQIQGRRKEIDALRRDAQKACG